MPANDAGVPQRTFWASHKWVLAILLVAFGLRLYWRLNQSPVISGDGAEYVRMAISLRDSHRLLSSWGGPETMYAPFYAVLMAALSSSGMSAEFAGNCIALVSGTALVLMLYLVALYVYGQPAAYFTGILAAIHPLFISLSASIYSESVYLTLWITGIYFAIRALDSFRMRDFVLAGFVTGLAYLTRPEAFAYPLFFGLAAWTVAIFRNRSFLRATSGALLVLGSYGLVALPYVAFLHAHTGQYRLEGKWNINYTIGNRRLEGVSAWQAGYEVRDDLSMRGPLLDPVRFAAYTPYPHGLGDKLRYVYRSSKANWPELYFDLSNPAFGSPFLLLLVFLGLFALPWDGDRLAREFVLLTMALSVVVLLASAHNLEIRYSYPFVPLATIWSGKGFEVMASWFRKTSVSLNAAWLPEPSRMAAGGVAFLYTLLLLASYFGVDRQLGFKTEPGASQSERQAGLWLREHGGSSARISAMAARLPYYARGTLVQFPYANSDVTLRYLDSQKVDFIGLESSYGRYIPTLSEWLKNGIPDRRAQLVYDTGYTWSERVRIYRWNHDVSGGVPVG